MLINISESLSRDKQLNGGLVQEKHNSIAKAL